MCGIAGFFSQTDITSSQVEKTLDCLRSRGPDGFSSTFFQSTEKGIVHASTGNALFLHTRLSIRDLSSAATQPMKNHDGSLWIVYNGEVYGWEKEAEELKKRGYHFQSNSDTEFILHGYEEWGDDILEKLRGMFSFAILDLKKARLFLARDRLGEKPLFYTTVHGGFAFASTARALAALTFPQGKPRLNSKAIDAFLAHRYIPAPLSIFENFYKLPAAHSLLVTFDRGKPIIQEPHEYWKPEPHPEINPETAFAEAVSMRLVSDRPLGIFLSGGIDSQAIAHSVTRHHFPVPAVTAGFPGNTSCDESHDAETIAHRLGLDQTTLPIKMEASDVAQIITDLDEPFGDPSAIPTWYLCQAAVKKMVVALTGDAGDELFAGYKRYQVHTRAARLLPRHGWHQGSWQHDRLCLKTTQQGRLRRALLGYELGWEEAYVLRFSAFDPLSRAFLQPDTTIQTNYWRLPEKKLAPLEWMLECDRLNYLPEYILRKSDLCGMAHGLELRSPMLDHRFVEAVQGMHKNERFTTPPKEFLIKKIIGPHVLLGKKRGFNPPLHDWLHQPLLAEICHDLPKNLEQLTEGQLPAERLQALMQSTFSQQKLDELVWLMAVLFFSLKSLYQ